MPPCAVAGGSYTVDAEGAATINFRAVDGAGNETLAHADVKVDRTPPTAAVTCVAGAGTSWVCTGSGTDVLSRVSSLSYSVDGSAAAAVGGDGSFVVQKGTVVVQAIDGAGNTGASAPVTLADRTPPPPPPAGAGRDADADAPGGHGRAHAARHHRGRAAPRRRLCLRAPCRPALHLGDADPHDRRPAPACARQGPLPVRAQGHGGQEDQDRPQDADDEVRLLAAHQRARADRGARHGRTDRAPQLRRPLGHRRLRQRRAGLSKPGAG